MHKSPDRTNGFHEPLSRGMMQARVIHLLQAAKSMSGGDYKKWMRLSGTAVKWYCRFIPNEEDAAQVKSHARLWLQLAKNMAE